jgi:hypothetical protein
MVELRGRAEGLERGAPLSVELPPGALRVLREA